MKIFWNFKQMFSKIIVFCLIVYQSRCSRTDLECPDLSTVLRTSVFGEIRKSPYYVDKTLLLYKLMKNEDTLLFTAPPEFGKSANLDMMRVFLSNAVDYKEAQDLFADTNIAKDSNFVKTHLGNYPVIHCSFKPKSFVTDYNTMVANFRVSLHKAFSQHQYLKSSKLLAKGDLERFKKFIDVDNCTSVEPSEISSALHFLSKILKTHHSKRVILLIDDCDSVIWNSVITESLGIREVLGFFDAVFNEVLTDKNNVKKSILTGTSSILIQLLRCSREVKCVKFLHDKDFEPFFGLTDDEVDRLADQSLYVSQRLNLTDWYSYTNQDLSTHIYSPKSLLSFFLLSRGQLTPYWTCQNDKKALTILLEDSVRKELLLESPENLMFVVHELKEVNEGVMEGVKKMINLEIWDASVSDLYIHLLMERGYFTFDTPWEKSGYNSSATLRLANLDVCGALKKFIVGYIQEIKRQRSIINIV